MTEAVEFPNPYRVLQLCHSNFSLQDFQDPCGLQVMDRGRCCLRANALIRFHAIYCTLRKLISLVRAKIRMDVDQDICCCSRHG